MQINPENLKNKLQKTLPGASSHLKLAPTKRAKELADTAHLLDLAKKSAVMILFYNEKDITKLIFIRRSFYVGIHAGQIAFPGGRYEESDFDIQHTALREIEEEIGIKSDKIEVLGRLTDIYVPPSNFLISIFVGYLKQKPIFKRDEREVAEIIEIDLNDFFKENTIHEKDFVVPSVNESTRAPYYKVGDIELWGASAMVMTELLDIIKQ